MEEAAGGKRAQGKIKTNLWVALCSDGPVCPRLIGPHTAWRQGEEALTREKHKIEAEHRMPGLEPGSVAMSAWNGGWEISGCLRNLSKDTETDRAERSADFGRSDSCLVLFSFTHHWRESQISRAMVWYSNHWVKIRRLGFKIQIRWKPIVKTWGSHC